MTTPTNNGRDAKISDLLGISLSATYLHPTSKCAILSRSIGSGRFMRILFPKRSNDAMLDCRSIAVHF